MMIVPTIKFKPCLGLIGVGSIWKPLRGVGAKQQGRLLGLFDIWNLGQSGNYYKMFQIFILS